MGLLEVAGRRVGRRELAVGGWGDGGIWERREELGNELRRSRRGAGFFFSCEY